jgi:D-aminopeptidase
VNAVVGETNDGWLNDIRGFHIQKKHIWEAIEKAESGLIPEGSVGAGTGTCCLGYKGGIGTASRRLPKSMGGWTIGVIVQSNFGGILQINGAPVGRELNRYSYQRELLESEEGSCMIIVATDAPLLHRNLKRLASRAILGLARCGGFCANGSGDYVIAFSAHEKCRIREIRRGELLESAELPNSQMTPLFLAVVEATEEAVYNSLFMATAVTGRSGHRVDALPIPTTIQICQKYKVLNWNQTLPGGQGRLNKVRYP